MTQEAEMREMILTFAATLARRCVEGVTNTGLSDGRLVDKTEVGGVEWHFDVRYFSEPDVVAISGHPAPEPPSGMGMMLAQMFGVSADEGPQLGFTLPVSWLPE